MPTIVYNSLFLLACGFVSAVYAAQRYVCFSADKSVSYAIAWSGDSVHIGHMSFYKPIFDPDYGVTPKNYLERLDADAESGSYNLAADGGGFLLNYVQDTLFSVYATAGGYSSDFLAIHDEIRASGHALVYSAAIPNIETFAFDKASKTLTYSSVPLASPRAGTDKIVKHWVESGAQYTSSEELGAIPEHQLEKIFFSGGRGDKSTAVFTDCEAESAPLNALRRFIDFFRFAW